MTERPLSLIIFSVAGAVALLTAALIIRLNPESALKADKPQKIRSRISRKLQQTVPQKLRKAHTISTAAIPAAAFTAALLAFENLPIAFVVMAIAFVVTQAAFIFLSKRRANDFPEKYAQGLRALASSLKAGLSIAQAVSETAGNQFLDPEIRAGFQRIASEIAVGISAPQAFQNYADATNSPDAKDVAAALKMQSEVGGSESEAVATIASAMSDRVMAQKEIKSMFTGTTVLIIAMDFAPFLAVGIMYFAMPQLMSTFTKSTERILILAGIIVITLLGSYIIHKLANSAKGR